MADSAAPRGRLAWSPVQVEQLLELHRLGLTGSQIASRMGVTRNAIIGKLSRLLGPFGASYDRERVRNRVIRLRRPKPPKPPKPPKLPKPRFVYDGGFTQTPVELKRPGTIPQEPSSPLGMPMARAVGTAAAVLAIERGDCRWPIGDPRDADFRFCGAWREGTGMYCAHHERAARGRANGKDQRSDSDGPDGGEEMHQGNRRVSR